MPLIARAMQLPTGVPIRLGASTRSAWVARPDGAMVTTMRPRPRVCPSPQPAARASAAPTAARTARSSKGCGWATPLPSSDPSGRAGDSMLLLVEGAWGRDHGVAPWGGGVQPIAGFDGSEAGSGAGSDASAATSACTSGGAMSAGRRRATSVTTWATPSRASDGASTRGCGWAAKRRPAPRRAPTVPANTTVAGRCDGRGGSSAGATSRATGASEGELARPESGESGGLVRPRNDRSKMSEHRPAAKGSSGGR
jgi:hypothetical protein